ncbi:MAG: Na/Pi cotransporter family protein [Methanothrix sp.]|nr:Na/Pi cotransporter family protein [Methanothrix sp.]
MNWSLLLAIVPVVVLFLYGIDRFSEEVRHAAGERFWTLLQNATRTPARGALAGAAVSAITQSSTATTVIAVGLVNAGAISFLGSIGLVIGANVGTTLTAQLVAFKLTAFAPLSVVAGFLLGLVRGPYRVFGKPIFYFGLVFFSLNLISAEIAPLQDDPEVIALLAMADDVLIGILIGFVITNLFQSSSVTAGLIVVMAQSGLLTPAEAVPIILGANIGTTTTGLIVAIRMNSAARRTAVAQFLFNLLGVVLILPLLGPFSELIREIGGSPAQQVANSHLIFNLSTSLVFLAGIKPFGSLVMRIVPEKDAEVVFVTRHLRDPLPEDSSTATGQVEMEIVHMMEVSREVFEKSLEVGAGKTEACARIEHLRDYVASLNSAIEAAVVALSDREMHVEDAARISILARVSDLVASMVEQTVVMAKKFEHMKEKRMMLSTESLGNLMEMAAPCRENLDHLVEAFPEMPAEVDEAMRYNDEKLRQLLNWYYKSHVRRLAGGNKADGMFSEMLFSIERIGSIIRELRKTTISMAIPVSPLDIPDLVDLPDDGR